jgi:hypothetical protein
MTIDYPQLATDYWQLATTPHPACQLTTAAIHPIISVLEKFLRLTRWLMVQKKSKGSGRPFSTAGERLDDMLGDTTKRIEEETQALIAYINDELVPAIREHSSYGLRIASEKLQQAADMMDAGKKQKKG